MQVKRDIDSIERELNNVSFNQLMNTFITLKQEIDYRRSLFNNFCSTTNF